MDLFCPHFMARREGFEPPETLISTVFKTAVIDHSTISAYSFVVNIILQQTLFVNQFRQANQAILAANVFHMSA